MLNPDLELVQRVQQKYTEVLMSKRQVVGVSIGLVHQSGQLDDEYGLIVLIDESVSADMLGDSDYIPTELDGVPVRTQAVGNLKAQYVGR